MNAVTVRHVSFSYPGSDVPAVRDASFVLERGSYTALAGLNGSGKSTVARIIAGLLACDSGNIEIDRRLKVSMVFQSPKEQIICGTVSRDTAFGPQNIGLPAGEVELRTIESLNITGMLSCAQQPAMALSLGQTQKIAFSGIIALRPDILILDEAVSMLDPASREDIFMFLDYWNKHGNTILHITHDVDALRRAGNVIVMKNGAVIWNGTKNDFFENAEICGNICGKSLTAGNTSLNKTVPVSAGGVKSFIFDNISFSYGNRQVLRGISFSLEKGTLTALTGVSGSGKSTLLEIAAGLLIPSDGAVLADSRPVLAQQNCDAALFETFAADDVAFGAGNRGVSGKKLVELVKSAMNTASLPFEEYADRQTFTLSGGEKRRLAIAGIIALDAQNIFFDEPTAAIDGPARYEIMQMMRSLAESGKTVLFSTHRRDEAEFADRNIHIASGEVAYDSACSKNKTESSALLRNTESLPVQKPLDGAKLLASLRRTAAGIAGNAEHNKSFIVRLPPLLKYLLFFAMFITSLSVRPVCFCAAMFVLSVLYALTAKYPAGKLFGAVFKVIPLLLFFCVFQMVFFPAAPGERVFIPYKYFTVTPSKLILCLKTLLHTESVLCCICAFVYSTPEYDMIEGLSVMLKPLSFLHIPVRYVIIIAEIIFRFIPLLIDEASSIIKTQLVRGGLGKASGFFGKIRALLPLFVPLIVQTVRRSEALADALTVRGFK